MGTQLIDGVQHRTRIGKQPRAGDYIEGPTGLERVIAVHSRGGWLDVEDAIGRHWVRRRNPAGWWAIRTTR